MARETIADLVRMARERRGLTQAQVGRLTHYQQRTISDFERGNRREHVFEYAIRLARALDDITLFRRIIEIETGVPIAGIPVPDGLDRHPASLRDLARREEREATEAMESLEFWRLGPAQRSAAERVAKELLDSITAQQWAFDSLCERCELDPDELIAKHRRERASELISA